MQLVDVLVLRRGTNVGAGLLQNPTWTCYCERGVPGDTRDLGFASVRKTKQKTKHHKDLRLVAEVALRRWVVLRRRVVTKYRDGNYHHLADRCDG